MKSHPELCGNSVWIAHGPMSLAFLLFSDLRLMRYHVLAIPPHPRSAPGGSRYFWDAKQLDILVE